jgi:DNA-binding GntR family transcriptional regulator
MNSKSLIQTAYDYIREQIMLGEFMPGTLLSENQLAESLNMSRTPVRTAISQLESEGLVISLKNRGILVKEVSMKEAMDMSEVMYTFQKYAVDCMEDRGELPDLKKMKDYLELQLEATAQGAYHRYVEHYLLFTRCIIAVINNNAALQIMDTYRERILLYSSINYKITPHEPHYSGNKINQSIYDALLSKNYEEVRRIFQEVHLKNRERMLRLGRI